MSLSSRALCTLTDLKTELGITVSTYDSRLERIIEAVTYVINNYLNRSEGLHNESARVDYVRGFGTAIMYLPKTPVVSISSIVFDPSGDNETVDSSLYSLDEAGTGRVYREDGWLWTASNAENLVETPLPGTEERLYKVTYNCGYVTAGQGGTRTLPYDIEDVCLQLAASRYKWTPIDPTVSQERLGAWSASYNGESGLAHAGLLSTLDGYRKLL